MVVKDVFGKMVDIDIPLDVFPTKDELEAVEAIVPGCQHGWYKSVSDAADLHYRYWTSSSPPPSSSSNDATTSTSTTSDKAKGIVIFTHGIHSHSGHAARLGGRALDMALLVDTFTAKGMNVYARDMYGHGLSEGTRFYIPSWKDMVTDLVNFVQLVARENPTDIPIFLCGESLGGTLTILVSRYFQDHPTESPTNFDSSLLICPAIEADLPPFPVYQILRYVLAPLYPKWRPFFMPNTISPERIWKDPTVCEGYTTARRQEMQLDGVGRTFRLGTAVSMLLCLDEITTHSIPGYKFPFCIVHGDEDMGIPLSGTHYFYQNVDTLEKEKEVHVIPTAYHGLLADPKAEVAIDHLTKFVDGRVKAFVPTPSSKTS